MNEWAIVGVLATLVTLFISLATPMIKLNTAITKLTAVRNWLEKEFSRFYRKRILPAIAGSGNTMKLRMNG